VNRCPVEESGKTFSKIFTLGVIFPKKSEIESRSNRYRTQSRLQVTEYIAERYCLLHVVVQGPGRLANFLVRRTVAELRGVKIAQFSDFGLFSLYRNLKRTFWWLADSPGVTSQKDYDFCRAMICKRGLCSHAVSVCVCPSRSCIVSKRINFFS